MSVQYAFSTVERDVALRVLTLCHRRPLILIAHAYVHHERYERTCRACGFEWEIDRQQIKSEGNTRMDRLEWSAASRIGIPE